MRLLVIALLSILSVTAFAQEVFKGEHFIETTGTAQTEIEPNEITLFIKLREFEEDREKVQLEKLDKDFLSALKAADIDRKRLEIADAGSNLSKLGKRDKDAFREKSYQLKVTSASELEKFLEKIEPVKVYQVKITRVHHTDIEKLKLDLKIQALQAAKSKAESLLKGINQEMGKPIMIREWDMDPIQPYNMEVANVYMRQKESMDDMAAQEPSPGFRKIILKAQVMAQFEIK